MGNEVVYLELRRTCPKASSVSKESQVFIVERYRHVDDTASLRTESWRTLNKDRQLLLDTCLSLHNCLPAWFSVSPQQYRMCCPGCKAQLHGTGGLWPVCPEWEQPSMLVSPVDLKTDRKTYRSEAPFSPCIKMHFYDQTASTWSHQSTSVDTLEMHCGQTVVWSFYFYSFLFVLTVSWSVDASFSVGTVTLGGRLSIL